MKGLIPAEKLYYRLMTDAAYNKNDFDIVYYDAIRGGYVDMPIVKWVPKDGDIPFHRVYFFKYKGRVIWHRKHKLFTLDQVPKLEEQSLPDTFRVVTLNVLFDLYESDVTDLEPRVPAILAQLDQLAAQVVCLQEVTPRFVSLMRGEPTERPPHRRAAGAGSAAAAAAAPATRSAGARRRFDPPTEHATAFQCGSWHVVRTPLDPYGVMTLSRVPPVEYCDLELSAGKLCLRTTFRLSDGQPLDVFNVHLTSDVQSGADETRALQLRALAAQLPTARLALVAGDFNSSTPQLAHHERLTDAWAALWPDEDGFTFDVAHNPLAARLSARQRSARFDRVLLSAGLTARAATVHTELPACSDHFALSVDVCVSEYGTDVPGAGAADVAAAAAAEAGRAGAVAAAIPRAPGPGPLLPWVGVPTAATTALVIIPPVTLWPAIQELRREHDPAFQRWMPHLCVYQHFVAETHFAAVAARLQQVPLPAFEMRLSSFDALKHRRSETLYARPDEESAARMHALADMLAEALRVPKELRQPHLTVGKFEPAVPASKLKMRLSWAFPVQQLCLISRERTDYFRVRQVIPLTPASPPAGTAGAALPAATATDPLDVLRALTPTAQWQVVGSHLLGVAGPDSDLDLLAWGSTAKTEWLEALRRGAEQCGAFVHADLVENQFTASLKLWTAAGREIDVHYVCTRAARLTEVTDSDDVDTLSMYREPMRVLQLLGSERVALFQAGARWLKERARQCGLLGQMFGYLGGLSWALLAAYCVLHTRQPAPLTAVADFPLAFVRMFAHWDWQRRPVKLDEPHCSRRADTPADELMMVLLTVPPHKNTARNLTPSTARATQWAIRTAFGDAELAAAAAAAAGGAAGDAAAAVGAADGVGATVPVLEPLPALPFRLQLWLTADSAEPQRWMCRRLLRLVVFLDRKLGAVRPASAWTVSDTGRRWGWSVDVCCESTVVDLAMSELQSKLSAMFYQQNAVLEYSLERVRE